MKTALLATSALVLSAGLAHAQAVTISGEGRMGIQAFNAGVWTWNIENRLTLNFDVAIEADHGLTFGAWMRARTSGTGGTGLLSNSRVWVEANGLRLTFGNADGALATAGTSHGWLGGCMVGYEGGQWCGDAVGLDLFAHQELNPGLPLLPQALLTYSFGDTEVAISHQRNGFTEVAARTTFGAVTVAAGYTDFLDIYTVSGHYNGGAWGVGAIVAGNSATTNWALSGNVQLGGGDLYGYVGRLFSDPSYGLSYGYGLGGGATMTIGAERIGGATDVTTASLGIAFTF